MFTLFERNINVTKEAIAKRSPTYFSEIIFVRNVEFIYADNATCKVNMNDKTYIRLILFIIV
jgi:hypothetical protein